MKVIGVIPARLASTRLKEKVLRDILGKPMIARVWERSQRAKRLDEVIIACDDKKIVKAAQGFGAKVILTRKTHPSGSDRIAEAVKKLKADIVVNIQGDEPLIAPSIIDNLVKAVAGDKTVVMATVVKAFGLKEDIHNPNIVKVVIDQNKDALYFSRSVIPFIREKQNAHPVTYYKHLGIYAYRKNFLLKFVSLPPSRLEKVERLEQLRALEAGYKIRTVLTDKETISVDTPSDLKQVIRILKKRRG